MKNTKKALLTSALCLLLCCSMLIGTTFAWFTDEVKSGNNIIQAGNLDVELEYAKVVNGQITAWDTVAGKTAIFDPNALWEPGHVEVVYLKVSNLGTLELKYQLGVNIISETPSINVENEPFALSEHLVFKVVEMPDALATFDDREAAQLAAGTEKGLKDYNGETKALDPKGGENDMDYVALIVYMPETVGNEANYKKDAPIPTINLGINLFATQKDAESDSFGPDYDEDAWHPEMKVYSAQDLQAAINNGETNIIVMDDIVAEERIEIPADAKVTLDMNGHKLATTGGNALYNQGNLTIIGTGEISSVSNYAIRVQRGSLIIDSADITVSSQFGAVSVFNGADVTINGGNYSNTGYAGQTSHTIYVGGYGTVNINGGTFDSGYSNGGIDTICGYGWSNDANEKAVINLNGGEFYPSELNGSNFFISNYASAWTEININGGTYTKYDPAKISGTKLGDGYKSVDNGDGTYTVLKGEVVVTDDAELVAAIADGKTEIAMAPGNYQFPLSANLQGKTLTLVGTKGVVIDTSNVNQNNQFVTGANLKFEGVTLNFGTAIYMGFANTASLTYKDCAVNGLQFVCGTGTVSFENCDLNSNGAEHSLWTWGISNISFTGCDFTYGDRAVNCYAEHGQTTNASFTDCTFTKVAGKEITGAIETNSSLMTGLNLTILNCSVNEGDLWWVSTWDSKGGANTYTTVDGKVTVATAKQLAAVVAKGATDIYLLDGEYNVEGCGGKTLTLTGSKNAVLKVMNEGEDGCDYGFGGPTGVGNITFNGLTIDTTANTGNYKGYAYMKGTFNDCNFVGAYSLNNANDFVFNRCTFDFKNGYFWTWGANSVTFDECVFNGNSKAILAHGSASTVINIKNCAFAATEKGYTGSGDNTAVVEMDPIGSNTYTINFTGENTITDSYAGWTRVKDGSTGHIITGLN